MAKPGEKNSNAKLWPEDVRTIRELAAGGRAHAKLGVQFGVTQQQVSRIVARIAWAHV